MIDLKPGDYVLFHTLKWFEENCYIENNKFGHLKNKNCSTGSIFKERYKHLGKIHKVKDIEGKDNKCTKFIIDADCPFFWVDWMIVGKVNKFKKLREIL
jgi:hypothetical protein